MATQMFFNLPVADLPRSRVFFESLGFHFNPAFTNDQAACLVISETHSAMLMDRAFFQGFVPHRRIIDAHKEIEVVLALSVDNREGVDTLVEAALKAGAREADEPKDHGFMYERAFEDLDGHAWQIFHMDMSQVPQNA